MEIDSLEYKSAHFDQKTNELEQSLNRALGLVHGLRQQLQHEQRVADGTWRRNPGRSPGRGYHCRGCGASKDSGYHSWACPRVIQISETPSIPAGAAPGVGASEGTDTV